jgi:hypothetical protein
MSDAKVWDKESIQALLDREPKAVIRGLRAIAARQTASELATKTTTESNGVGFSYRDAPFLTDMMRQVQAGRTLSPKQFAVTKNMVKRYWRQLAEIANATAVAPPDRLTVAAKATEAALTSFDLGVKKVTERVVEARNERLEGLDCDCENMDGERICDYCMRRNLRVLREALNRAEAGSW